MVINLYRRWRMRWRRMDKNLPPIGSRVDLWAKAPLWSRYHFGMVTTTHANICGVCWNDGDKGMLVLDPKITRWRYSMGPRGK